MNTKFREGDFVETKQGSIFDVKGLIHPPNRVIAFVRYFPSDKGIRKSKGALYEKVYSLSSRYDWLRKKFPQYLVYDPIFDEVLCEVPIKDIKSHFKPTEALRRLRKAEKLEDLELKVLEMANLLKSSAKIHWNVIGASGSVMVGLHTPSSDIDLVVYGSENCQRVYAVLRELLKTQETPFKPYEKADLRVLFDFRSKDTMMSFEDFVAVESRKVLQGKFMERDYFIRFVKDWNEISEKYGDVCYRNCGYTRIEATVADDSESIFTPCTYKIENVKIVEGPKLEPIEEISSFRGRFCEQAKNGETVIAQGKLEHVTDKRQNREYFRILLGGKTSDYMVLKR
ncbi:MAG: nucleotidyltransferase domain-containing protein [Candidatus Bathyarchaeales archaeon]